MSASKVVRMGTVEKPEQCAGIVVSTIKAKGGILLVKPGDRCRRNATRGGFCLAHVNAPRGCIAKPVHWTDDTGDCWTCWPPPLPGEKSCPGWPSALEAWKTEAAR